MNAGNASERNTVQVENPSFFLEGVVRDKEEISDFEGPLSLILMLLSKNKIEIRDIRISDILQQYLDYLAQMQSMDLEIASEFVQMASHLLYIKTRTLLTGDEEVSELELLMASLEQLKARDAFTALQSVLPELKKASELGALYFTKLPEPPPKASKEYCYRHEPVELLKALYSIYSRGGRTPESDMGVALPKRIVYSVRDKSVQIISRLREGSATLDELYAQCATRSEVVATFVSILELCSFGSVFLSRCGEGYLLEFTGGDIDEILEKIVE